MTDEAAGFYEWARRAAITSDEAWEEMQAVNQETEWDVEQMLSKLESPPDPSTDQREPVQ